MWFSIFNVRYYSITSSIEYLLRLFQPDVVDTRLGRDTGFNASVKSTVSLFKAIS